MHHIILMTCCLTWAVNCLHAVQVNFIVRIILFSPCSCYIVARRHYALEVILMMYLEWYMIRLILLYSLHVVLC